MTLGPWFTGDAPTTNLAIKVQRDGAAIELDDFVSAEALLYDPAGESSVWDSEPTIDYELDVINVTPPTTSPFSVAGFYMLYVRLRDSAGRSETFLATDIQVLQLGASNSWATIGNVRSITGETVSDEDVSMAQGVIELYSGRTFTGSQPGSIRPRDSIWLQKAVAYQAVWQRSQPGYQTRHAIKEVNQDGAQIIYAGSSEPNNTALIMLAPLANRALKNLSWLRNKSIKLRMPRYLDDGSEALKNYKSDDGHGGWRPM